MACYIVRHLMPRVISNVQPRCRACGFLERSITANVAMPARSTRRLFHWVDFDRERTRRIREPPRMNSAQISILRSHKERLMDQQRRWTTTKKFTPEVDEKSKSSVPKSTKPRILSRLPISAHENIYTIPNILTFSRLAAAPTVGYLLVHDYNAAALGLFAYAGVTDLVDGYIARRYNLQTVVGTVIDPMADKLLMTISVICLGLSGSMPVWLAAIILGRDVGLALSAIYYRWISLPPPKTMSRYWDFSLPSAEVKPTGISKFNTALQLVLVGSSMALPLIPEAMSEAWGLSQGVTGLQYLVAVTTIWSGLSYIFSKDAVKILTKEEVQKRISRANSNSTKDKPHGI